MKNCITFAASALQRVTLTLLLNYLVKTRGAIYVTGQKLIEIAIVVTVLLVKTE